VISLRPPTLKSGGRLFTIFRLVYWLLYMRTKRYHLGLLYMIHLLISSDGEITSDEEQALELIKKKEGISEDLFRSFRKGIEGKKGRDIYKEGIEILNECTDDEKLDAFAHLYRLSEADGNVHVKEVRLLLYSIRMTGIEFNDVVEHAKNGA
jgi:uncharacterized tellurite resistance protein B-like protein